MRDHFQSRDKDGGQTIRPTIAKNPVLHHAKLMALCFMEPELRLIEVVHRREFRPFLLLLVYLRMWPVFLGDTPDVQGFRKLSSDRFRCIQTDRQTRPKLQVSLSLHV